VLVSVKMQFLTTPTLLCKRNMKPRASYPLGNRKSQGGCSFYRGFPQ